MDKLWRKNLRNIEPYVPGEQSKDKNIIKLNANENPYPPSPKAVKVLENFKTDKLRLYPDANAYELKSAIAKHFRVDVGNVFVGNGSDDVIALCFQSFFNGDLPIAFPDITYSFYPVWCRLFNINYVTPALDDAFRINPDDYKKANGGVIIPNPNAPTSIGENPDFVKKILEYNRDSIVIIDEAYVAFGGTSSVGLINEYDNLVIVGTFSKSHSLAGMRIGYAIASQELISVLEAVKNSYNSYTVDSLSVVMGAASISDEEYFNEVTSKIVNTRKRVTDKMRILGFDVLDSSANFIMATHSNYSMKEMFEYLKTKKIFIRYFNLPRIDNSVRISIGTDEEMDVFLREVENFISKQEEV